jgi:cytochrome c-type biogenesis protein CcmE
VSSSDGELDQVDADGEPPEFDLSPRTAAGDVGPVRRRRNVGALALLGVLGVAAVLILSQALGSATTYFYTADQAVAKRASLGSTRFRIEGTVIDEPARSSKGKQEAATFTITANDIAVPVSYLGEDPPALFKRCEPVVLVGKWDGTRFRSDQIIVKHTTDYTDKHPGRLTSACPAGSS